MGQNSKIQWTDHTFNPWIGCTKVSPGCAHCYAEGLDRNRFSKTLGGASKAAPVSHWGKGAPRHRTSLASWRQPLAWDNEQAKVVASCGGDMREEECRRPRVFCASLADWLDEEVDIAWLADLLDLVRQTPHLDWLLLTKRPENWATRIEKAMRYTMMEAPITDDKEREKDRHSRHALSCWLQDWFVSKNPPANVWVGTTVEDQARANERLPLLRKIPAKVRFLSCEPMLEAIDLAKACDWGSAFDGGLPGIHWVICGGESGPGARPFCTEWAWELLLQCRRAGVRFFTKQLGSLPITSNANALEWPEETVFADDLLDTEWAAGGSVKLADKKGGDMAEWPEELKVQEFPR